MDTILNFNPDAIVIDAGNFPTNPLALSWLNKCQRVVCCDGAADRWLASGHMPWRIVGDCDSMSAATKEKYKEIIRRFPDQETNDQTKAITYLKNKGFRRIVILGATGRREDHTLGNISLLVDYLKQGIEARIYTDYGTFIPVKDSETFHCPAGTQVSIFNFGASHLHAEGLRYPIRNFDSWWQGTLNETEKEQFTIHAHGYLLLFINYPS